MIGFSTKQSPLTMTAPFGQTERQDARDERLLLMQVMCFANSVVVTAASFYKLSQGLMF